MAFGDGASAFQPVRPPRDSSPVVVAHAPVDELLDDALERLAKARAHMMRGEAVAKDEAVTRCLQTVVALRTCPDADAGLATGRLDALCGAITRRLQQASAHSNVGLIDEISGELQVIRDALD